MNRRPCRFLALAALSVAALARPARAGWPDLSLPPPRTNAGQKDAAVIVGIQDYAFVAPVPGARRVAEDWQAYLTETLGVPLERVTLLRDDEATLEALRRYTAAQAAAVKPGGTLWFVFIGHGAPSRDGKDGLLIGADAQATADSLEERSLKRGELLRLLARGRQAKAVAILDSCFSGRDPAGRELVAGLQPLIISRGLEGPVDARTILMTAAASNQFAGPLPDSSRPRPAFSYLALGALRGWAADAVGAVTAGGLIGFARKALSLAHDRAQTPELSAGAPGAVLGRGREAAPDLAAIERDAAAGGFRVSTDSLAPVPRAAPPEDPGEHPLDFRGADAAAWADYDAAYEFDRGGAAAEDKARRWRELAAARPALAAAAQKRAAQWELYAERGAQAAQIRLRRAAVRDADWGRLEPLLRYEVVPQTDKRRWAAQFTAAYLPSPGLTAGMARRLAPLLPPGRQRRALDILERGGEGGDAQAAADSALAAADADVGWLSETPARNGERSFQFAAAPVTLGQYRRCVAAGACTPLDDSPADCGVYAGDDRAVGPAGESKKIEADERPAVCASWSQASAFSQWVGGRLPTTREWESSAWRRGANDPACAKPGGNPAQAVCGAGGALHEWAQDWRPPTLIPTRAGALSATASPWSPFGLGSPFSLYTPDHPAGWYSPLTLTQAAARFDFSPETRYRDVTFRPARPGL